MLYSTLQTDTTYPREGTETLMAIKELGPTGDTTYPRKGTETHKARRKLCPGVEAPCLPPGMEAAGHIKDRPTLGSGFAGFCLFLYG